MKIAAFGYHLRQKDYETIKKMCRVLSAEIPEIYDLQCYEVNRTEDTIVLVYGEHAQRACEHIKCLQKIEFPDASRLDSALGENAERLEAAETLKKYKEVLDSNSLNALSNTKVRTEVLTEESLVDLTANRVTTLERHLKDKGINYWQGITKNGKSIRVTVEPEESPADINMTFAELYAVMGLREAFRVKELEIAYKPSSTSK